jgi:uncharacterized protein
MHTLTVWLHLTERCNLHCTYCYATRGQADMDPSTGQAAVESVFRSAARHSFRTVKLKYAGGEPSLNFPLVRALHAHAQSLAEQLDLELREVLLSNGVALSDAILRNLGEKGMRLALSLDGIGAAHDALRGAGTFRAVSGTVDRALALGLRPHITVTVTSQNVDNLEDVVAYILERDLPFNLNFFRENTCTPQGEHLRADADRLLAGIRAALARIEGKLPEQSIASGLLDRANLGYGHTRPCGVGQNYVAVDPQGRIARCHMELEHTLGNVREDDPVMVVRQSTGRWQNLEVDAKEGCRDCIWRYYCAGGCPLLTYRTCGRYNVRSPYCQVYQALYPEIVRLEGLRLLKWH